MESHPETTYTIFKIAALVLVGALSFLRVSSYDKRNVQLPVGESQNTSLSHFQN